MQSMDGCVAIQDFCDSVIIAPDIIVSSLKYDFCNTLLYRCLNKKKTIWHAILIRFGNYL